MARTNGPFGPPGARAPVRRLPADGPYGQAPEQWPVQGLPDQSGQGYHFPPPEPDPNYGYNQQQLPPPQWGQHGDQRSYDLASYQPVGYSEPGPFQQASHHHQAYTETDDYREEFFEDEEPRRSRRWIFIVAALVGAIGVGGALAYTYRSLIAPGGGRVPLVKADGKVKVKPEHPGGKESADKKLPNRVEAAPPSKEPEPAQDEAGEEKNLGPRPVKTTKFGPDGPQVPPPIAVPGITLQNTGPPPRAAEPPPPVQAKVAAPPASPRVTIGERPPAPAEEAELPPPVKKTPVSPPVAPKAPPAKTASAAPPPTSGYVVVVASKNRSEDALKVYADLHQKHPDLLGNTTPAVQESDQSARGLGLVYRLVVGPPGSRETASGLCNRLKAAGQDCWVMAY